MAYGVKVEAKIEVANVDGEALRKAIQKSLDSVTKDNPIVISKFSAKITKGFGKTIRDSVQKTLDDSLNSSPIQITKFTGKMLAHDRNEIIKKIKSDFKNQNVEISIKSFNTKDAVNKLRNDLTTMLNGLTVEGVRAFLGTEGTEEAYNKAASAAEKLAEAEEKIKKKNEESISALQRLQALRTSASGTYRSILNIDDDTVRSDLSNQYADLFKQIEHAKTLSADLREQEISDIEETVVRLKTKTQAYVDAAKEAQKQASIIEKAGGQEAYDAKQAAKAAEEHERAVKKENEELNRKIRLKMQIQSWTEKETKAYNRYRKEIDTLLAELNGEGKIAPSRLEEISLAFNKIKDTASGAGVSGKAFFNVMKDGMARLLTWTTIYAGFRRMISYVIELDAAMTELKKVTNLTSKEYDNFLNKSSGVAREVGASIADTVNATADFSRLGFGIEDASDLAEAALVYKNVGDGITNISFATESLISTIKAFNIEASDSMDIVDKFNEVGKFCPAA